MAVWQIQLLGGLRATRGSSVIAQFPSRPIAMLLARLALQPQRRHAREELIELLWPDVEPGVGRNRLRQVLSTLRRLLEPPGVAPDSVLDADRNSVGLATDAIDSDVHEFEQYLRQGAIAQAIDCYRGELLPGFLDEWVEEERTRLTALYERALVRDNAAIEAGRDRQSPTQGADAVRAHPTGRAQPPRSLPSYVSVFFGRESDRRNVLAALEEHRLVTIAGLGGFGKTRLATESARAAPGYDAVAFVPLSECNDADLIADCIRSALGIEASQEDALVQLSAFLAEQDVLLVLDNFEQLVDEGTPVLQDLLERLPRLRLLVTTRRVLNIPGERVLLIDPLPLPQPSMDAAEAAATPSLALFIDRARGARADFALTEDNRAALIALCRALEGLPLAIEIAASRIRAYSPTEMCSALAERFELLRRQGQRGARYGRHMSLQTTIEWSWNLLGMERQRFFAALSVFRGGWTAAAVESICGGGDPRGQLEALVADSLVRADAGEGGVTRFSMLETLREFAEERLDVHAPELRARHRAYFLGIARKTAADGSTTGGEFANLKQALLTATEDDEPAYALDLGVAMRPYWEAHGTLPDELRLLNQAVANCPKGASSLHAGLNLLAQLTLTAGDAERARGYAQRALQESGDQAVRRASALITLACVNWERDQHYETVMAILDEALALAAAAGVAEVEADALRVKATVTLKHGSEDADHLAANALFERAEALYRQIDQPRWANRVLLSRSACLVGLKRYDEARRMLTQCEQYFAGLDSVADLIAVANMTGFLESGQERWQEAVAAGRRCVQLAWDRHSHLSLAMALWNLPHPLVMLGEVAVAARLMSFASGFWERGIGPLSPSDVATADQVKKSATKRLGGKPAATLWAQGARLSLAEAIDLALTGRG